MRIGLHPPLRRCLSVVAAGILAVALTSCTGRGGGQLPPDGVAFKGPASFGFDFSCEDQGGLNPRTGQLRIQLSYNDRGSNPIGSSFSIHGIVDSIDPVLESMICIGDEPAHGEYPNQLIFLGRYRLTSSAPAGFPPTCPARETESMPLCRFEVIVGDNDMNRGPSTGDYFQIKLSSGTVAGSQLDAPAFYTRGGLLSSGNLTVS
jgi:hypothetical protein